MASYRASRNDGELSEEEQENARNAQAAKGALKTAGKGSKIAKGVDIADNITGGAISRTAGKAMTKTGKIGRRLTQGAGLMSGINHLAKREGQSSSGNNAGSPVSREQAINNNRGGNSSTPEEENKKGKGEPKSSPSSKGGEKDKKDSPQDKSPNENQNNSDSTALDKTKGGKAKIGARIPLKIVVTILAFLIPIMILFLLIFTLMGGVASVFGEFEDAIGISSRIGADTGGIEYETDDDERLAFYDRVNKVVQDKGQEGLLVYALNITAFYHVMMNYNDNLEYKSFSEAQIRAVADATYMYEQREDISYLLDDIGWYLPQTTQEERKVLVDEIYKYVEDYKNFIGETKIECTYSSGSCTYNINKGYYFYDLTTQQIKGEGYKVEKISPKDIQVRLIGCDGKPIEEEALVPFEKFVFGVAYGSKKTTSEEVFKSYMIGMRSYLLGMHKATKIAIINDNRRLANIDKEDWLTLKIEKEQWILQASACAVNSVYQYCDPDQGCSGDKYGNLRSGTSNLGGASYSIQKKEPLDKDSPLRKYALETEGEVLKTSNGYIAVTPIYKWDLSIYEGKNFNYKQVLLSIYHDDNLTLAKNSCTSDLDTPQCISTGEFSTWKQKGESWSGVQMGSSGKTIGDIGCLVTSVAMLIAKSGVPTTISNFNPGTFVEFLNKNGGFDSSGNFQWYAATKAAPEFRYMGQLDVHLMSDADKLARIRELANTKGYYVVAEVKGRTGQHWVAIDSVTGNNINMMDPGSKATNMWNEYPSYNTSTLAYYKTN